MTIVDQSARNRANFDQGSEPAVGVPDRAKIAISGIGF